MWGKHVWDGGQVRAEEEIGAHIISPISSLQ
jgi:hypothetical protein